MTGLQNQLASFTVPYIPATPTPLPDGKGAKAWQQLIDDQLIEWGRHPEHFDEEGMTPPTACALGWACKLAAFCRDRQIDPPLRAAPDGSGGIAFEWRIGPVFLTVEVRQDGEVEMLTIENSKLMLRMRLGKGNDGEIGS
jgi:hypothetical protein